MGNKSLRIQGGDGTTIEAGMVGELVSIASAGTTVTVNAAATKVESTTAPSKGIWLVLGEAVFVFATAPTIGQYTPMGVTGSNFNAVAVNSSALPSKPSLETCGYTLSVSGVFVGDGSTKPFVNCLSYNGGSVSPTVTFTARLVRLA